MSEYRQEEEGKDAGHPLGTMQRPSGIVCSLVAPVQSTSDQAYSMGCEGGPCGLPIGGPPESRRSAPVRSGGANRTAVGVKRP